MTEGPSNAVIHQRGSAHQDAAAAAPAHGPSSWLRSFQLTDLIWLLLFAALVWSAPHNNPIEVPLLLGLAANQVVQARLRLLDSLRANLTSIAVQLVLTYVLMGYTGGIASSYYILLLLPVLTAATTLGAHGTTAVIAAAILSYLSLLLVLDWSRYVIPPDQVRELLLRVSFLPMSGLVTYQLAEANRRVAVKHQTMAEQLAAANRSLQEAEAAFRRSERLAALGQLTAGLAHELRNPMGTIRGSAEMLAKTLPDESTVGRELAGFISTEVDRANSLITRFLEFARPLSPRRQMQDLTTILDRSVAEMERLHPDAGVSIIKNYATGIAPFLMDDELMRRVFYNLLLNAVQASATGGAVTVKTRTVDSQAEIAVIDRGSGIAPADLETIFNPFFTTKGEGVGLGLAIVSKIVDEHGGRILVESEVGKGSVFRVYLPMERHAIMS